MTSELFSKRSFQPVYGYTIIDHLDGMLKPEEGSVGIEVEVEGNKFPKPSGYETTHKPVPLDGWNYWSYVKDGSLRGHDNAEYVLTKPIPFEEVPSAINELSSKLLQFGSVLDDSNRTSVHVHLNCQQFHMNRLTSFIALWVCFEEVLTEWCGDHRVGNLFCLRAKDAPGALTAIKKFIQTDCCSTLPDGLHYAGLNASALTKFGSLEIRSMRGPTDLSLIQRWVDILERLYNLSAEYSDPRDIPALFSQQGPLTFFETLLGFQGVLLRNDIGWTNEQIRDSMYEGIRLAQDLCYCRDWSLYTPVDIKKDPFGRKKKTSPSFPSSGSEIMQALMDQQLSVYNPAPPLLGTSSYYLTTQNQYPVVAAIEEEQEEEGDYDPFPEYEDEPEEEEEDG